MKDNPLKTFKIEIANEIIGKTINISRLKKELQAAISQGKSENISNKPKGRGIYE